ncbi:RNA-binding S4 domain-containing protein [Natribacillus halophilus]|uniref:RQC P-site tRNA stabilizing factor n=1 Tax=Natribacillus halophilus TaxID=549003 RepID=A0A1G8RIH1_9BACI|nr:RNA-binding S4 domain-containing protein [Natribacillus halophilus]SDJ16776.1 Ribosomal 50S subunit-recycling heat shock protein, contains S4 domain [Natribacillus halophilus]
MRIDKFLKVSRLIKRRTIAKEVAGAGRLQVNGQVAKAGTEVSPGDEVTIQYGRKTVKVRVERLDNAAQKGEATNLYTTLEEAKAEEE